MLQSRLLADTVQLAPAQHVLFLNSAANPFVMLAVQHLSTGVITLAEDNIAALHTALKEAQRWHISDHIYRVCRQLAACRFP